MFCQINLFKPSNVSYKPGDTVAGLIKYAVHDTMEFEKITTSLKGGGHLKVQVKQGKRHRTYTSSETYVDIDNVITSKNIEVPVGCYEIKFSFKIPEDIPPSLEYIRKQTQRKVTCRIKYYIRIKFERPGWFAFTKHFRKEIVIVSGIKPKLLMEPVIYGESKKLMRLFSRKDAIVNLKATILSSVIPVGGKIHLNYEVKNDTNVDIKCLEVKVMEVYTFKAHGHSEVIHRDEVRSTIVRMGCIEAGATKSAPLIIDMPLDRVSLQNSTIVSRDYSLRITTELPMPHRDMVLNIPVQVGTIINLECLNNEEIDYAVEAVEGAAVDENNASALMYEDPPPTYWEAMGETAKCDTLEDEFDCTEIEKGEKSGTL